MISIGVYSSIIKSPQERFNQKWIPEPNSGCWLWTACQNNKGYGSIRINGKMMLAHRFSYEIHRGSIPEKLSLDHLCRTPLCVNPNHLEIVTHRQNVLRGISPMAKYAKQTHCKRGHLFSKENIYDVSNWKQKSRPCKICRKQRYQERKFNSPRVVGDAVATRTESSVETS